MFHIVLYEPEIPSNTGNIIRLCANTGAQLHLIQPLGFTLDDKKLRRAGLDYHEWVNLKVHSSLQHFFDNVLPDRMFALTTKGTHRYTDISFQSGDAMLFGPETRGLPTSTLSEIGTQHCLHLPMREESRSMNLSNTVSVVLYEAWRQQGFDGGK
jgi:tRNA (cytidine/uridine-2'-O-)-methyltransferase